MVAGATERARFPVASGWGATGGKTRLALLDHLDEGGRAPFTIRWRVT
ncbi:MAG: hypothetical protein GW892_25550 [Armatimonadetes bacterium]|nr:hypothetical protein [Armatimonadota bacterium]